MDGMVDDSVNAAPLARLLGRSDIARLVLGRLSIRQAWLCRRVSREFLKWCTASLAARSVPTVFGGCTTYKLANAFQCLLEPGEYPRHEMWESHN
eukprot:COSAG03_NODE_21045_length_310_cov_0.445498_1_plen_94_part_10